MSTPENLVNALEGFSMECKYLPQDITKLADDRGLYKRSDVSVDHGLWNYSVTFPNGTSVWIDEHDLVSGAYEW